MQPLNAWRVAMAAPIVIVLKKNSTPRATVITQQRCTKRSRAVPACVGVHKLCLVGPDRPVGVSGSCPRASCAEVLFTWL